MEKLRNPLLAFLVAAALAACSSSSGDGSGGPGGDDAAFKVTASGEPVDDPTRVVVEFTGIEVQPQDGDRLDFDFDEARAIDLLDLQGRNSAALLEDVELDPGDYSFLRLKVNAEQGVMDSFIEFSDGSMSSLFVPSGEQQGLRLVGGFVVDSDGRPDFTIDFDLRKSIHRPASPDSDYFLRPALRMVDNNEVGHLTGTVGEQIAAAEACFDAATASTLAAIYVYEGADAQPGDVCSAEGEEACPDDVDRPLATTMVSTSGGDTATFVYEVGFLAEGDYTAALTCDAAADDPETDDREVVSFDAQQSFSIEAGQETQVDFGVDDGEPENGGVGNGEEEVIDDGEPEDDGLDDGQDGIDDGNEGEEGLPEAGPGPAPDSGV